MNAFVDGNTEPVVTTEPAQTTTESVQSNTVNAFADLSITQPIIEKAETEPVVETQPTAKAETKYVIDGQEYTVEQIKEWKQGNLRQSDYTKKTQELKAQREQNAKALEVYNYLQANPMVAEAIESGNLSGIQIKGTPLASLDGSNKVVEELSLQVATMQLDRTLDELKARFPDFDEVEVLTYADANNTTDLKQAYYTLKGQKASNPQQIDRAQIEREIREKLTREIQQNGIITQSIISSNDTAPQTLSGLTTEEMRIADAMKVSYKDYAKYKK